MTKISDPPVINCLYTLRAEHFLPCRSCGRSLLNQHTYDYKCLFGPRYYEPYTLAEASDIEWAIGWYNYTGTPVADFAMDAHLSNRLRLLIHDAFKETCRHKWRDGSMAYVSRDGLLTCRLCHRDAPFDKDY